jgi:polyisoprenoid-binding protein YceI
MKTMRCWSTTLAATMLAGCTPETDVPAVRETATATGEVSAADVSTTPAATAIRFTVAATGNVARYRVREQLMGRDLPNDAIGETQLVTGGISVDSAGRLVPDQSRFVVQTSMFKSDSDRRDGYVRGRLLQVEQFPTVELVPTAARGLPARLPVAGRDAGPGTFELIGDLTVRGVTHPTTWRVTARQVANRVTGTATTKFTFTDFGITPPRVPIVLSVADTIALELDFSLERAAPVGK